VRNRAGEGKAKGILKEFIKYHGLWRRWRAFTALLIVLTAGCSINADNPAGYEYTGRGPSSILTDTLVVTGSDTTWAVDLSLEKSPLLFVGEFGDYRAAALLRFSGFPEGAQIQTSRLVMHGIRADASGDSTDTITLNLYRVTSTWDSTWGGDELESLNSILDLEEVLDQINIPLSATADTIGFSLPVDLVQSWAEDAGQAALGVALVADTGAPFFLHLDSADASRTRSGFRPQLRFDYVHPTGGDVRDESLEPNMDLSMVSFSPTPAADELWVGRGSPYRTLLTFDISQIPAGITVNRAVLRLGVRMGEGVTEEISVVAALPLSSEPWNLPVTETMTHGTTSLIANVTLSDSTASLVVTRAVAVHLPRELPQLELMVVAVGEGSGIGMIVLWDSTAQSLDLARLEIIYSLPSGVTP
jgi:hypothetical protein